MAEEKIGDMAEEKEVGVEDLCSLIERIREEQVVRISRLVSDFANSFNMTEEEVLKLAFPEIISQIKEPSSQVPAKYVNPENPNETWAGRGRVPKWMEPLLEQGHSKEEFLIKE